MADRTLDLSPVKAVEFHDIEPLQDYFIDRDGNRWSVARLIDMTKHLPVVEIPLAYLDLSGRPWQDYDIYHLAFHHRKTVMADLSVPIILGWNGCIMDGRHRVIKALANRSVTIKAVKLTWRPEPCYSAGED